MVVEVVGDSTERNYLSFAALFHLLPLSSYFISLLPCFSLHRLVVCSVDAHGSLSSTSQGAHSPGIVNFVNDTVVKAVQTLFDEISAVFPSAYVHMGGDEVSLGWRVSSWLLALVEIVRARS